MRQLLFAGLLVLVGTTSARAQGGWANKLFDNQVSHDFGTVAHGAQILHRFPIKNIYAVPLEIIQTRASCGCVTVLPNPKILQPRESGTIDVSLDTRRFKGPKAFTIHVTVGPTYVSTAELKVNANSRTDVVFNPGQVNLGTVTRGQQPNQKLDIEYAGALDWRITEVLAKGVPFSAELQEMHRRPGGSGWEVGYQIKVTLKPDAPPGPIKQEVHLKTNDPTTPLISVLVEANVEATLIASPNPLPIGTVRVGETLTRRVVVRGQQPFRITRIDGLGEGLELEGELSTKAQLLHTVTFRIQASKGGNYRRSLQIRTDAQSTSLPLNVEGVVSP